MKKAALFFISTVISLSVQAQARVKDSLLLAPMFTVSYSYQIPGGDLKTRFGNNSNIGAMFLLKTKSNWLIGADYSFLFGNKLKETGMLDSIKTATGTPQADGRRQDGEDPVCRSQGDGPTSPRVQQEP